MTAKQLAHAARLDRPESLSLDPFAAFPELASTIAGLGGSTAADGPGYVFKTALFAAGEGKALIRLRFIDLTATKGHLIIELSNRSRFPGTPATRLSLIGFDFAELAAGNGEATIEIDADANTRYAIGGHAANPTDAAASGIVLELEQVSTVRSGPLRRKASETVRPAHGSAPTMRSVPELRTIGASMTFAGLSSQPSTPGQLDEPDYRDCLDDLGRRPGDPDAWPAAFVLQAARLHANDRAGRRVLCLDAPVSSLPAALACRGWKLLVTSSSDDPSEETDLGARRRAFAFPPICAKDRFDAALDYSLLPSAVLPRMRAGLFDLVYTFTLGTSEGANLGSRLKLLLKAVKPGGLAIVVVPFDPGGQPGRHTVARPELEKAALTVLASGHDIFQLRFDPRETGAGWYGIIARKGERP